MSAILDLTGIRSGRLQAMLRKGSDKYGKAFWWCLCDCGRDTVVMGYHLRKGETRSCGCLRVSVSRRLMLKIRDAKKEAA